MKPDFYWQTFADQKRIFGCDHRATNIVQTSNGQAPPWVTPSKVFTVDGVKVGVIGAGLKNTPELVSAGATAGCR